MFLPSLYLSYPSTSLLSSLYVQAHVAPPFEICIFAKSNGRPQMLCRYHTPSGLRCWRHMSACSDGCVVRSRSLLDNPPQK